MKTDDLSILQWEGTTNGVTPDVYAFNQTDGGIFLGIDALGTVVQGNNNATPIWSLYVPPGASDPTTFL
jgi:hypothetical protein